MAETRVQFSFDPGPPDASSPKVEFVCDPAFAGRIPAPDRAAKFTPDWFRSLPRNMNLPMTDGQPGLTARACLPMADVFSLGFILPLPLTVRILETEQGLGLDVAQDAPFQPIEAHHPGQIGAPTAPFEDVAALKFINPWRVKVPQGYSVLFTAPFNHVGLPFTSFSGLVDCDRFETNVNIPFLWRQGSGDVTLEAGTPIAQMIPIRRDALLKTHAARPATEDEVSGKAAADERKYGEASTYSRDWRVRK